LLGFSEVRELQLLHAALFLLVYLAALAGNLLIVAVTVLDRRLHTPMYFFLRNLSVLDLCYISVTVPKSIHNSLTNKRSISFLGCATQLFSVLLFASSELFLLTAMSHDRYAAICLPLRYEVLMDRGTCGKMAAASWLGGGLFALLLSPRTLSLPFCGSILIQQFFCDIASMVQLSCSETHLFIDMIEVTGFLSGVSCFISIVISYVCIFRAVLRMPASEGRAKAFSTCLPHLVVTTVFFTSAAFGTLHPTSDSSSALDLLVSVFYTVVPPALNPLIYSLRNRDMKMSCKVHPHFLNNNNSIAFLGCIAQLFLWIFFVGSEDFVLKVMSYYHYAAIWLPLRYEVIMDRVACGKIAAAPWLIGGLIEALFSCSTFSMSFCGYNVISQFFCDVPTQLKISCSEEHVATDVIQG
ncbi:olfactory receptor 14A16-like, partial [Tachyglossus aculeatus]|uniref:olfactory receptor 14A16-like n=1 Tax=Tachyglossus aculeatus TaxID=9261 RepID=UPI0018F2C284